VDFATVLIPALGQGLGNVVIFIGCEYPIDGEESTVREFNDGAIAAFDDMVVRHDPTILTYQAATALGDRVPFLVRHD